MKQARFVLHVFAIVLACVVPVGAQQRPIVAAPRPALATPQGPITITMPDGSTLSGATNQLLVFLTNDATTANQQAVTAAVTSTGAQIVGELPTIKMLQVQVSNPATIAKLIVTLRTLSGVAYAGPSLFAAPDVSACDGSSTGPIPGLGPTGWVQANRLAPGPPSANDVIIGIIDDFAVPGQAPPPGLARHGDVVAAYAIDAGGTDARGNPVFKLGQNVFEIPGPLTDALTFEVVVGQLLANNPGKKIVLNQSRGPGQCNAIVTPNLRSANANDRARARAECVTARNTWDKTHNRWVQNLVRVHGDRLILVNSAGNVDVPIEPSTSMSSCHFIPVGGFDQTSPTPTLASFTTIGAPMPVYAPACNISPVSLTVPPNTAFSSGTSFASPQIAGQLAAIWAAHPDLNACQMGSQLFALPKLDPTQTGAQFNGQALAALADAHSPVDEPVPSPLETLPCPAISVTPAQSLAAVNQTIRLTPVLQGGGTTTFRYISSNPVVASVDETSGLVRVNATGIATISVTAPDRLCAAQANVIVPAETYAGTFSEQFTGIFPNEAGWTPNPYTVTGSVTPSPIRLTVAQSLLQAGVFAGFLSGGPGTASVTVPTMTCTVCIPPTSVPGSTYNAPFPESTIPITGTSDGRIILIPLDGGPPLTGTVSVLGSVVQLTLNWNYQENVAGGTVSVRLNSSLTKQ